MTSELARYENRTGDHTLIVKALPEQSGSATAHKIAYFIKPGSGQKSAFEAIFKQRNSGKIEWESDGSVFIASHAADPKIARDHIQPTLQGILSELGIDFTTNGASKDILKNCERLTGERNFASATGKRGGPAATR